MRHLVYLFLFSLGLLLPQFLFAQAPEGFNYQAVIRDNGNILSSQSLDVTFTIHKGSPNNAVYTEQQTVNTNTYGVMDAMVGNGTTVDTFENIEWGVDLYFLEVEIDPGSGQVSLGTTQLISVPYSLYAKEAGEFKGPAGGDLRGNYPDPIVQGIQTYPVSTQMPTFGQVLKWEGSLWIPMDDSVGSEYAPGPGITIRNDTIINTAQDQVVSIAGAGATQVSGNYPSFTITSTDSFTTYKSGNGISVVGDTITNTAPDQLVGISGAGSTTVSGAYPNFTISSSDSVNTYSSGTGIDISGLVITNTAPDQTVTLTGSGATTITGGYPAYTITSTDLVNDADSDTTNELQTLGLVDTTLSLSDGGSVSLADFVNLWSENGVDIHRSAGNVGIGTSTPATGLNVAENHDVLFGLSMTGPGAKAFWDYSKQAFRAGQAGANAWNEDSLGLYSTAFGLGTVALGNGSFAGGFGTQAKTYGSVAIGRYNAAPNGSVTTWVNGDALFEVGNGSISNRNNAFTIRKDGRVGVNDATPDFLVDIENANKSSRGINLNHTTTSGTSLQYGVYVGMDNSATSSGVSYGSYIDIQNDNNDAYGINILSKSDATDSSPAFGIRTSGDNDNGTGIAYGIFATIAPSTSTGAEYAGYFSGDVFTTGSYLPSDLHLKSGISLTQESSLAKLMDLQVKSYTYNRDQFPRMNLPKGERVGFVAQEVEQVMPELVKESVQPATLPEEVEEGEPAGEEVTFKAVDYNGMVPHLVKALQEQQALIEAQQQQIKQLEQRLNDLEGGK